MTANKLLSRFPKLLAHTKNIKINKINLLKLRKKKFNRYLKNVSINLYLDEDEDDPAPMLMLEDDKKVKLEPEETFVERAKLNSCKRKNEETVLEILTPNKLLSRFIIILAQIKAGNNSKKLKNEMRQILNPLYQHNKITKNL